MNKTISYTAAAPTDYAWSIFVPDPHSTDLTPPLTSETCAAHLTTFMHHPALVAVATESSSHPTGLESLYAQPWLWAGGGLGNMDECPLQTCVAGAGGLHHATTTLNFATLCVVPECSAADVAAPDFPAVVDLAMQAAVVPPRDDDDDHHAMTVAQQYATAVHDMHVVNKYLGTGWTCGAFVVPWQSWPFGIPYLVVSVFFLLAVVHATTRRSSSSSSSRRPPSSLPYLENAQQQHQQQEETHALLQQPYKHIDNDNYMQEEEETKKNEPIVLTPATSASTLSLCWRSLSRSSSSASSSSYCVQTPSSLTYAFYKSNNNNSNHHHHQQQQSCSFWSCFDARQHLKTLVQPPPTETAILDGLRVGSMLWIMLGHVMAIISSSGAGYANPQAFLPPDGLTNTVVGQLLFSSRLAVDTFLVISGFLTVHVLVRKLPYSHATTTTTTTSAVPSTTIPPNKNPNALLRYLRHLPSLTLARVARILPLYAMCLLFYTQVAPKMGGGPFWYQWLGLLKPCHDYGWTNLLFINNFWPLDQPITNTCFYHSWYLAVDMQLFLAAALLVCWYQGRPRLVTIGTALLWVASVVTTAVLAAIRHWSANTFDGAAVARYDMEAYAKPHIRAVAYLTGMMVAMVLPRAKLMRRTPWRTTHHVTMAVTLVIMAVITFCTAAGAYARRPCRYQDWPQKDECGSTWSPAMTWLYTSASRAAWCLSIGIIMHLCLGRPAAGNPVAAILSWSCWTPLSHLTFGAYLIHPIVIFIWQLGDREKEIFRIETFCMDYISVGVVSYVAALVAALTVEFPCAALWKQWTTTRATSSGGSAANCKSNSEDDKQVVATQEMGPPAAQQLQVMYGSIA